MCTVVILRRPDHPWPLILGANRDEQISRPWQAPARHWEDRPEVVAALDEMAGGSWMGINDWGVVVCILNRRGTLGPQDDKRSRGEIVLEALDHEGAVAAAEALAHLDGRAYRGFNLIIADNRDAYWLKLDEAQGPEVTVSEIPEGLSILTASDLNDPTSEQIQAFLPRFSTAPVPDPGVNDWAAWQSLMGARAENGSPFAAMCFRTDKGFGTSSSALVALPSADNAMNNPTDGPVWLFAPGPPDEAPFEPVALTAD